MANSFSNNKKTKMIAAAVADSMDYLKASVSKMSAAELKNKKFGRTYTMYLPGVGKPTKGTTANPEPIAEIETEIMFDNWNNSVTLTAWNDLVDIESFKGEIIDGYALANARAEEKDIVTANCFKSVQAYVASTPSFDGLSEASDMLGELAVSGEVVSFMHPTVMGKIASSGLANFLPDPTMKEIYGKNYLGEYANASQLRCNVLPVLTTPSTIPTATITLGTAVQNSDGTDIGFDAINSIATTGTFIPGLAYKATGLKVVDNSGIQTDQDYVLIVNSTESAGAVGKIPQLRIAFEGQAYNNANAWVPAGTSSLTLTPILTGSKKYWIGQVRTKDCMAYDTAFFSNLPGSENENVATVGGVTVKVSQYGNGNELEKLVRIDQPFAAGLFEPRRSVTVYIEKA